MVLKNIQVSFAVPLEGSNAEPVVSFSDDPADRMMATDDANIGEPVLLQAPLIPQLPPVASEQAQAAILQNAKMESLQIESPNVLVEQLQEEKSVE